MSSVDSVWLPGIPEVAFAVRVQASLAATLALGAILLFKGRRSFALSLLVVGALAGIVIGAEQVELWIARMAYLSTHEGVGSVTFLNVKNYVPRGWSAIAGGLCVGLILRLVLATIRRANPQMKRGDIWLMRCSLAISGGVILAAAILPRNLNIHDPQGFIVFWAILIIHSAISVAVLRRGLLVPVLLSLAWFFGTGIAAFMVGIAVHGIP
jgi:hypothetical protein